MSKHRAYVVQWRDPRTDGWLVAGVTTSRKRAKEWEELLRARSVGTKGLEVTHRGPYPMAPPRP